MHVILVLCIVLLIFAMAWTIYFMPIFKISFKKQRNLLQNGLLHYTTEQAVPNIIEKGLIGHVSHMGFPENLLGNLIWMYPNSTIEQMEELHSILLSKHRAINHPERYDCCLLITQIESKDLEHLRYRLYDGAIVYCGDVFKPRHITVFKHW